MTKKPLPDKEEKKQEAITAATKEDVSVKAATKEDVPRGVRLKRAFDKDAWIPKTNLGKKVKLGEIKEIDEILDKGIKFLESEIVDALIPNLESDLLAIGQSKGKFGGGKRSIWRQTQKKTQEGNKPSFSTMSVVGNKNGYMGIGYGKARETVPAREKANRMAKMNLIKIKRGCGSWECACGEPHSIPFKVVGKCGSIKMTLHTAPKGAGLVIEKECKKLLEFAGIRDVYSKTLGHTATKLNLIKACFNALKKLSSTKVPHDYIKKAGIIEGATT